MNVNKIFTSARAEKWYDSFPLGNGHMGAMVMSKGKTDRVVINDECLWCGFKVNDNNKNARKKLAQVRKLIFENKRDEAQKLASENFLSVPPNLDSYEFLTNFCTDIGIDGRIERFRRELDLQKGVSTASYKINGEKYKSTYFVSGADDVCVVRYETTGLFDNFRMSLYRGAGETKSEWTDNSVMYTGQLVRKYMVQRTKSMEEERQMKFALALFVRTDGKIHNCLDCPTVSGATYVEFYFTTQTNYCYDKLDYSENIDCAAEAKAVLEKIKGISYSEVKKRSVRAHRKLYDKVKLNVEGDKLNNDIYKCLSGVGKTENINELCVLNYNYSRYLLIASGDLKSKLPANLQGIWCWETKAPWNSDFHTNINLQMNYWQADAVGLDCAVERLTEFMEHMAVPGRDTAKEMYGADGWCIHHCVTPFGRTGLHDGLISGILPLAGCWMMLNIFEHYEYTNDIAFLERIYHLMKGCAQFICDFLVIGPQGKYVTAPSASPENAFITPEGKVSPLSYGCSIDLEIVYMTLIRFIYASKILNKKGKLICESKEKLDNLMPLQISKRYGTLQEWIEDYEEVEPGHRHTSHLIGLYPGDCINSKNPDIYEAVKKSVARRVENGSLACSWSVIWESLFYARFGDGKNCENLIRMYFEKYLKGILYNVWDFGEYLGFQIDSMLGYGAVINEMLIQSHEGEIGERIIRLLPALPNEWKNGSISGIRARGGVTFNMEWRNGTLTKAELITNSDTVVKIVYDGIKNYSVDNGEMSIIDDMMNICVKKGKKYTIHN